ncbi:MAG TPA: DinB family protein, partial [Burkholderiaceae bacterium]|nr:DinB family protein [Burkholderiaceae bacterium]
MQPPAPALQARYELVRAQSVALAAPLSEADAQVQSMPDASPTKWHLAHTTWFFETFVLERFEPGFEPHHAAFRVLFNSYYQGVGEQHPRPQRGLVTRPGLKEVMAYRRAVDERVAGLLARDPGDEVRALVELGLQHEQQHQELILTDLKHLLGCNPLDPVYRPGGGTPAPAAAYALGRGRTLVDLGAGDGAKAARLFPL